MAALAEMGEVDEVHSKEDGTAVINGNVPNMDMETTDSQDSLKRSSIIESMDVDESENNETKERQDIASTTEDSVEENDHTLDESSTATDNPSELNEDESSQETKLSKQDEQEPQGTDHEEEDEEVDEDGGDSDNEKQSVVSKESENRLDEDRDRVEDKVDEDSNQIDSDRLDNNVVKLDEEDNGTDGDSVKVCEEDNATDGDSVKVCEEDNRMDGESIRVDEDSNHSKGKVESTNEEDQIHEIDSDDDDNSKDKIGNLDDPIELNDSGGEDDGDVMIVDVPKENGTEIIDLPDTPEKKEPEQPAEVITPRRSSRNIKKKSYVESDKEDEPSPPPRPPHMSPRNSEESDIEEVLPQDPLADSITVERISSGDKTKPTAKPTIVVKDTKRLVEIATKTNNAVSGKKEPTLVIIDTNSILSGHGPVPVNSTKQQTGASLNTHAATNYPTVLPMALPAQGMYPPNMRATITPIPMATPSITTPPPKTSPATITPTLTTPLLPTLTDDMFVVEAPSFIVPYVYEKPPVKDFKDFIKEMQKSEKKKKENADEEDAVEAKDSDKKRSTKKSDEEDTKEEEEKEHEDKEEAKKDTSDKPYSYFDSPLGKFFISIGFNLVQEYVQTDLLKQQKRKANREGGSNPDTEKTIKSLIKNLEYSRGFNEHFKSDMKKCEYCSYKTESALVMAYHLETPHMKSFVYKCNFCPYEVRSPHDILFHMEAEHAVRGHLERAPAFHQCPNCPFEDNQKGKLSRHLVACVRKFRPDRNLEPPVDWEPPAKIPRVPKMRQQGLNATATAYQALAKNNQYQFLSKINLQNTQQVLQRGRGRPSLGPNFKPQATLLRPQGMIFKQQGMTGGSLLVPAGYQLSGNQVFQSTATAQPQVKKQATVSSQLPSQQSQQPSISITPLPRSASTSLGTGAGAGVMPSVAGKPGDIGSKNTFVICEICDGYIKDLEQLRNHMQWIHKIKIHPKMIYNRPPLNCQKCQFRFFTDQGLERHLLGSHGLVTSSMQDAANKSKDSGRCPVCGRVYQWKLLNHVARDHNMTLKPAHLSYKCTVCTATFGMYKQFENHVYSAHSVVAKRVMDKKGGSNGDRSSPLSKADQMKPLKINDEITIIPQPTKSSANGTKEDGSKSGPGTSKSR